MRVLFIDIDTLRPDRMSCYGYNRNTTPNIDGVANEGVRFNNYYCSDAPCLPSRASLVSGMFGIHNGAVGHGGTAADKRYVGVDRRFRSLDDENNLFNVFRKADMYTTSISTFAERHSSWWFNAGFNETYNVGGGGGESGEEILPVALDWINRNGDKDNWFLHVHFWDPHTPYRAPKDFGNPFENEPLDTWINEEIFKCHLKHVGPHSINEINMYDDKVNSKYPRHLGKATNMTELKHIMDSYDTGIKYGDYLIGQIFDLLKNKEIYEDTAIIITSDHGENMGELGIYSEHATADHPTCNIPMIIKWPGGVKGHNDEEFHYNLDLAPTIADLLGVPKYSKWDGKSYVDTIIKGENQGRENLVLSQLAHVCQRSARFDQWLYIRTYHCGFHLFDKEMLFNLDDDIYEQYDLKDKYPEVCAKGAKIILDWHDEMMGNSSNEIDPLWTVLKEGGPEHTRGFLDMYLKRLEETNRSEGAEKLRLKYKK